MLISDGVSKTCTTGVSSLHLPQDVHGLVHQMFEDLSDTSGATLTVQRLVLSPQNGFPQPHELADLLVAEKLASILAADLPHIVIAIGSGSVTDVVKHAVHLCRDQGAQLGFWVVPTALTVTAFTSHFAVLSTGGHKETFRSALPDATLFCLPIIAGAPQHLTAAGIGDLVAGFVSYADWMLASRLGFADDFVPLAAQLMGPMQSYLLEPGFGVGGLSQNFGPLGQLAETLAAAGVAMNIGGSSAPQSGGEHATSHVIDLVRHLSGRTPWPHGLQVALTTQCSAALHEWCATLDFIPVARVLDLDDQAIAEIVERTFWLAPFSGSPSEFSQSDKRENWIAAHAAPLQSECDRLVKTAQIKASQWRDLRKRMGPLQSLWPQIQKERLELTAPAAPLAQALANWGLPLCPEDMTPAGHVAELRWALRMSVFFRPRFGIQDLAFFLGEDPVLCAAL
jgi:glycerol-1-phosphate dehydrogenase [NAD(P)+]